MTGLDLTQAAEIVRATFRQEVRGKRGRGGRSGLAGSLYSLFLIYVISGFFMGLVISPSADPFTMAFISSSVFFLLVGTFVTMEFSTIVTGPEDFSFYSPLPVSARTYVTAKIAAACCFALAFSSSSARRSRSWRPSGAPL